MTTLLQGMQMNPLHPLSRGLVGWWPCNEGSGSIVRDVVRRQTGVMTNMDTVSAWVGSPSGLAVRFDGSNDAMNLGLASGFMSDLQAGHSISLRVKTATASNTLRSLFGFLESNNDAWGINIERDATNKVEFILARLFGAGAETRVLSDRAINDDIWHHLVVSAQSPCSATDIRMYIDGVEVAVTSVTNTLSGDVDEAFDVYLGARNQVGTGVSLPTACALADVRVYNRPLSGQEVQQLYSNPYANVLRQGPFLRTLASGGTLTPGHTYQYRKWSAWHQSYSA